MKRTKLFMILPALALIACSKDIDEDQPDLTQSNEEIFQEDLLELANPESTGAVSDVYFAGMKIPVEEFEGKYLYQGDILFAKDMVSLEEEKLVYEEGEVPPPHKSVGRTSGRWTNNTVYYSIDSNLDNQARVTDAIKHWESNTNLKFVRRTSEPNYINFVTGSGCSSYVGMIGGKQDLTLSTSCSTGNTIHEIGHAIGLWHEQSRVDRGSYITINYENIQSGREHNFQTYQEQGFDGAEYTSALDFQSIMMYGSYSFSKNGLPTIVNKSGATFSVQRTALSTGDVTGINNMYPYTSSTETTEVEMVYENGNYYTVSGLRVYRMYNRWYYYHSMYGWKEVRLSSSGYWYYA